MFISKRKDTKPYIDSIFPVKEACKNDNSSEKIDATVGTFCDEDGKLVAFKTVYDSYNSISNIDKAQYASGSFGNKDYIEAISKFVLEEKVKHFKTIPVSGGTGGITLGFNVCCEVGQDVLIPSVAWGNYKTICTEYNVNPITYDIYDLDALFEKIDKIDGRVILVINSPCQNPCGLSYTYEQWGRIFEKLNSCGKEVVLINDVAYMDFAYENPKQYFDYFNKLNDNVLVLLAYSCSKAFSYYGMRLGALFAINNDESVLETFINLCGGAIRATYSSCSNSAMKNITDVVNNHLDEYLSEKKKCIDLLKQRADIFVKEAKECDLPFYPYSEGYFVTIKMPDNDTRDKTHKLLMDNHIYTIKANLGIRVGICSVPKAKVVGLAKRIKEII